MIDNNKRYVRRKYFIVASSRGTYSLDNVRARDLYRVIPDLYRSGRAITGSPRSAVRR